MQCGAVPEAAVRDRDRADLGRDARAAGAAQEHLAVAADRMRAVRVGVRVAPRPVLAGDRQLGLDVVVVRPQVVVARSASRRRRRPGVSGAEVAGVEAGRVAGVVHHRAADAAAGVVRAERHRVVAADRRAARSSRGGASPPRRSPSRVSGSQNGPASRATTRQPARASRCSSVEPPAPQPTIDEVDLVRRRRSGACRRAAGGRCAVPSGGSSQADSLRSRTPAHPAPSRRPGRCTGSGVAHLERLAPVDPEVLVAARVGRAGEADLVPRPGWE